MAPPPMPPPEDKPAHYPGINFNPPPDTLDPEATEGEAIVQWRKVDGMYTIVSFEGKPVEPKETSSSEPRPMSASEELDSMAKPY